MSFASINLGVADWTTHSTSNLAPEGSQSAQVRAGHTVVSYNAGGEVTQSGLSSLNTADFVSGAGILGTAQTPTGSPRISGQLQATDIVTVEGMQMQLQTAERLGYVERDANGRYVERPQDGQLQGTEAAPADSVETTGEALDSPALEADLARLCETTYGTTQVGVVNQLVDSGEINPNTISRAASEAGISPAEMTARLNSVVEAFQAQATSTIKGLGSDDPAEFFAWATENQSKGLKDAMRSHAMERTTKGYAPLYAEYVQTFADRDPGSVLDAQFGQGISARKEGNRVLISIDGREVEFKTAVRQGLITVKGA